MKNSTHGSAHRARSAPRMPPDRLHALGNWRSRLPAGHNRSARMRALLPRPQTKTPPVRNIVAAFRLIICSCRPAGMSAHGSKANGRRRGGSPPPVNTRIEHAPRHFLPSGVLELPARKINARRCRRALDPHLEGTGPDRSRSCRSAWGQMAKRAGRFVGGTLQPLLSGAIEGAESTVAERPNAARRRLLRRSPARSTRTAVGSRHIGSA